MTNKQITAEEAVAKIKDGMCLMVGGFLANGSALKILDLLSQSSVKNLVLICNDTAYPDKAHGKLIVNGQVSKVITSHIGTNPATIEQMNAGTLTVEFVPQGTLAEQIRAFGAGLGGVLTPTGLGTLVENGKEKMTIDGKTYLLEKPLHADMALLGASIGDRSGNLIYKGTSQNMNPLMATAADIVIAEVAKLVETGDLAPETVHTPGIFVDFIVGN
ncbi:MAG: 3-oxoacid CoA-transferase subunit A [Bacteroidales bacterium]|jgi:acetate CoA/acetoacetate CoA-transferase alpha subunit|nr:3-oxoacid CoA-transferase subunit A [Bacteroidales bacterium]